MKISQKCILNNQATSYTINFNRSNVLDVQMYAEATDLNAAQQESKTSTTTQRNLITCSQESVNFAHVIEQWWRQEVFSVKADSTKHSIMSCAKHRVLH